MPGPLRKLSLKFEVQTAPRDAVYEKQIDKSTHSQKSKQRTPQMERVRESI